jgi:hypothetical protein
VETNVVSDVRVRALFAADAVAVTHRLAYTAGKGGSVQGESPQVVSEGGDGTEVVAVPDKGWRFVAWSDGVLSASRIDTGVVADLAVVADFAVLTDRWTDIGDGQWTDTYGVTADQVDAVADGYSDGRFRPAVSVNRSQFSKMVVDGFSLPKRSPSASSFTDVDPGYFFHDWIEEAAGAGVVRGYQDGSFRPERAITRQQANSMLGRHLTQGELNESGSIRGELGSYASVDRWFAAEGAGLLASFADASQLAAVHAPYTAYLLYHGIVLGGSSQGIQLLTPLADLTRAQAAVLVVRLAHLTR